MTTNIAIIVAGGEGARLGLEGGKQLALVAGQPVLAHTIAAFEACADVDSIIVVVHPSRVAEYSRVVEATGAKKVVTIVPGGETRQDSVMSGLAVAAASADIVIVHDGARPLVTPELIDRAVKGLVEDPGADGAVVGHPSYDTVKAVADDGRVVHTEDRERLWLVQTPQVFRAQVLRSAYEAALADGFQGTDDASYVEHMGGRVRLVHGPRDNIKVTVPEDLVVVGRLLSEREARS